ncbi:hypothetical protein BBJ28_00020930 [Nothophytophthora sp. Chile5]|nr:hypothetical protein BBJ28_00020930 [Nothophytophthora sp. Chile5]
MAVTTSGQRNASTASATSRKKTRVCTNPNVAAAASADSSTARGQRQRKRTLKYLKTHELRFGVAPLARDEASGNVTLAVCLFCKHFGREERAGKKRKSATTIKQFRDSFRPDQYQQHHQFQHPRQWARYKALTDTDKMRFFVPRLSQLVAGDAVDTGASSSSLTGVPTLAPTREERQCWFEVKAAIVEAVSLLAIDLCAIEPTVNTRERQIHHTMVHRDYPTEQPLRAQPRWSPPPETFKSCQLIESTPPQYRVIVHSRSQMDFLMELTANGLSFPQITRTVRVFRAHAPTLLSDLIHNTEINGPTTKQRVAQAAVRAEKRFQVHDKASPEYSDEQTAEFVRLGVASSLNVIAELLESCWAFSLELRKNSQHALCPYLDVRVKMYSSIGAVHNVHLLAIPNFIGKCGFMMFQTLDRVLTAVLPSWRRKLLGVATNGEVPIPSRVVEIIGYFQREIRGPVLYRTWSSGYQLNHTLRGFYTSIENGSFLLTLNSLSQYVRQQPILVAVMGQSPRGLRDRNSNTAIGSWLTLGQETTWISAHAVLIRSHLEEIAPTTWTPSSSWWLALVVIDWIASRANAVFVTLRRQRVTVSQEAAAIARLANDCMYAFHVQGQMDAESDDAADLEDTRLVSPDGRFGLRKSSLLRFVMETSVSGRQLVDKTNPAAVNKATESLAANVVNMIESLVALSASLDCSNSNTDCPAGTKALPPVLPHELAQLSSLEFAKLVKAHVSIGRGTLTEEDVNVINEEHKALCHELASDTALQAVMRECDEDTSFAEAWALVERRFKHLEAFAGGLASVFACDPITVAGTMECSGDLALCRKEMAEARLLLADFALEGALHGQQFQTLMELQEKIRDQDAAESGKPATQAAAVAIADARVFDLIEHQRWSVEAVRVPLLLNVSAPETRGSYLKKHTTFLVTKEPHVDGVRRRFSDFEWLRFVLHARYTGLLIPSLPDKTAPVLKGDAFLASRMRGLQRFLNAIVSSPYLRSDAAVASFLDDMDETAWLTARKETAVLENAGPGHMRWLQRILCEHIASSPER